MDVVTAGGPTVAVRVPAHPVALALLRSAGIPVAAPSANRSAELSPTTAEHVHRGLAGQIDLILDAGPRTLEEMGAALSKCATIFWNGTLGVAEFPAFAEGSLKLAHLLASVDATVVVGGGETAALVEQADLRDAYTHVSTGGGASLEFIEGKELPGVAALLNAEV